MSALMPETIEPATGGSAGGPGGTLPLPKVKKGRRQWTQLEIVTFVAAWVGRGRLAVVKGDYPERFTSDEAAEKLRSLGVMRREPKPVLGSEDQATVNDAIDDMLYEEEPTRTLQIRYAIKALTALLPKRVAK